MNSNVSGSGFIVKENTEKIYSLDKIMYISGNDVAFADNVIKLFIQLLQESIQNVREALRNNDVQLLKKTVHKIKPGLHTLEIIIMDEEVHAVENLNAELLAPGTHPGRLTIFTKSAVEKLGGLFQ